MIKSLKIMGFILLISIIKISEEAAIKVSQNTKAEAEKICEDAFLNKYKPSENKCRPYRFSDEFGNPAENKESLLVLAEGSIACLLSGHKKIWWIQEGHDYFERLSTDLQDLKKLLSQKQFLYIQLPDSNTIIFSPQAKEYALLFAKRFLNTNLFINSYLYGHLLGYPDKDINALYIFSDLTNKDFESQKKSAEEWINANKSDLDQWAQKHVKIEKL